YSEPHQARPAGTSGEFMQCPPTLQIKSSVTAVADQRKARLLKAAVARFFIGWPGRTQEDRARQKEKHERGKVDSPRMPGLRVSPRRHSLRASATAARSASGMTGFSRKATTPNSCAISAAETEP